MSTEKIEYKRVGPPKVTAKIGDYLTVEITLNGKPDSLWQKCFRHPTTYKPNEAQPSRTTIAIDKITFSSSQANIKTNVEWMDNYIQQANDCYNKTRAEQIAKQKQLLEQERKRQEEIAKINESLKDL